MTQTVIGSEIPQPSTMHISVTENGLVGDYFYREGIKEQKPMLVFGGSGGGNWFRHEKKSIEMLLDQGFSVLTLAYFDYKGRGNLPKIMKEIPLEYFETAMRWLETRPEVQQGENFAVLGSSRGAELALILGTIFPRIDLIIANVPSSYVWGAYNRYNPFTFGAAWTWRGEPIPYISLWTLLFDFSSGDIIDKPDKVNPYFIPVEKMKANLLLLSAKQDKSWQSTEMSNRIIKRLSKHNYPYSYKHTAYNTGHNGALRAGWKEILNFLEQYHRKQQVI